MQLLPQKQFSFPTDSTILYTKIKIHQKLEDKFTRTILVSLVIIQPNIIKECYAHTAKNCLNCSIPVGLSFQLFSSGGNSL